MRKMYSVAHIGIVVTNAEFSSQFYQQVFGCEIVDQLETEEIKLIFLKSGTQIIELVEYLHGNSANLRTTCGGVDHIAFNVPNINVVLKNLASRGICSPENEPKILPDKKIIFVSGPDGERLELIEKY